jgi:hypothetical protein
MALQSGYSKLSFLVSAREGVAQAANFRMSLIFRFFFMGQLESVVLELAPIISG